MRLFRILMSLHYHRDGWSGAYNLPTFYVHAVDGEHAKGMALAVADPESRFLQTSGSAIAVDERLDTIPETYYTWDTTNAKR